MKHLIAVVAIVGCGGGSHAMPTIDGAPSVDARGVAIDAASSVPADPLAFTADEPFTMSGSFVDVPASYDASHQTPTTLLVWLHGCQGFASGDIYTVSPSGRSWISLAVGGEEGGCWDPNTEVPLVLAAMTELATHFNLKPRGIVLGGYSSGGDLAYRTMFDNAARFAGLVVENTSPYRDTGSSQTASLAAAAWKFNVVHLAHLQDDTYTIAGVRAETDTMIAAGFPLTRIEVDGGHYDAPDAIENNHAVPGTTADLATYLFPPLDAGWTAP